MKVFSICLFLVLSGTCFSIAQTSKGTKFLGLSTNIGVSRSESIPMLAYKGSSFSISAVPQFSIFIADKWELGAGLGYSHSQSKYRNDEDVVVSKIYSNGFSSALFFRRHLMLSEKVGFRTGPVVAYSYSKEHRPDIPDYLTLYPDENHRTFSAGINLGIEFFPLKRIGIAADFANISYNYEKISGIPENSKKTNSFNASLTNELSLSVFYVLGKNK